MLLHYKKLGEGKPLFVLHGVFGMLDNWMTIGRNWAKEYAVFLIDVRNHGHSEHTEDMSLEAMAEDIKELMDHLDLKSINLLGHSMGGKIAMKFAMLHPMCLDKLVVVDIGPKKYPMHHQRIIKGLKSLNISDYKSRGEADKALSEWIDEPGTRQFLLKNLYWKSKGELALRMNLPVIADALLNIIDTSGYESVLTPTLFVRGLDSEYITDEDIPSIQLQFVNGEVADVAGAGHWVHAQKPKKLYDLVLSFLED